MAIRQRGASWQIDLTVKGKRVSATADTKEEAEKLEAQMRHTMLSGATVDVSSGWTLQDTYDRCMAQVWKNSPHANNVSKIYPKLANHFGATIPMAAIKAIDIDSYFNAMVQRGKANGTINRHRAVLSKLFTYAIERKDISKVSDKPHMEHYKENIGRQKYFTYDEEKAIVGMMRHLGYPEQADFVEFLIDTGARVQSDGFALTWDRVDFDHNMLVFAKRKCDKITGIPLTKRVKAILQARRALNPNGLHVWPFKHWWIRGPWDRVKELLKKGDDSEWVVHTCRHTTASRLVQAGINLTSVRDFMGHSSIVVTQRYAHLAPTALLPCAAALEPKPTTDTLPPSQVTA